MSIRHVIVLVVAAGALLLALPAAGQARSCSPPRYPGSGYFTSLKVTGTSCATGRKVTLAHYRCRIKNGVKGRCRSRVLRFRCTETRDAIRTQYNARVICKRGSAKVVYTYQQNT